MSGFDSNRQILKLRVNGARTKFEEIRESKNESQDSRESNPSWKRDGHIENQSCGLDPGQVGRHGGAHPQTSQFLGRYFPKQTRYVSEELISCIVKEYSYLWRQSKNKQILEYLIDNLRRVFSALWVTKQFVEEYTLDTGLDGLINNVFHGIYETTPEVQSLHKHSLSKQPTVSEEPSRIKLIKDRIKQFVDKIVNAVQIRLKARLEVQMRRLELKETRVNQILGQVCRNLEAIGGLQPGESQRLKEVECKCKIQEVEISQSQVMVCTLKQINGKLEQQNQRLQQRLQKFSDYLFNQHDEQLRKYRSMFRLASMGPSAHEYEGCRSKSSHNIVRNKSVDTHLEESVTQQHSLIAKRSRENSVERKTMTSRKSKQRLTVKRPLQMPQRKKEQLSQLPKQSH